MRHGQSQLAILGPHQAVAPDVLNVVVPDGRIVATVCSAHGEWVQSAGHKISKQHGGFEFPPDLFVNFTIAKCWPLLDSPPVALRLVTDQSGVRFPVSNTVIVHARTLSHY
jgi:hypothetical protein